MPDDTIELGTDLQLTPFRAGDGAALVQHLNNLAIYRTTLRIPFPYTPADADQFLARAAAAGAAQPLSHLAIRRRGELIGVCGLQDLDSPFAAHRAELGYWVAEPCWGQGIATLAVGRLCRLAFDAGFEKLTAWVVTSNQGSVRVLEKNGFALEGRHPRHYRKDGAFLDCSSFGRLR